MPPVADWNSLEILKDSGPAPRVQDLHPFVFHPNALDAAENHAHKDGTWADFNYLLDLPFERVWIEAFDGAALHELIGPLPGAADYESGTLAFTAWGMAIHELSPGDYALEMLGEMCIEDGKIDHPLFLKNDGRATPQLIWKHRLTPNAGTGAHGWDDAILFMKLQKLFRFARGEGTVAGASRARSISVGKGMKKRFVEVKDLVHIVLKRDRVEYERQTGLEGKVDWTHKWQVRGHWRKVDGIGKDRSGSYQVKGATWVNPHQKGKGPLVEKIRFVRSGAEAGDDGKCN
ncbi:MAG: hypothetical protein ACRBN8_44785 [Nannocystales bacterium]